jgi:Spy/CpxP family protein refolding chaperone
MSFTSIEWLFFRVRRLSGDDFMKSKWFLLTIAFFCATAAWAGEALSPYTRQETREIKALSKEEIDGYLSGSGMGFAKAAELNHCPGPRHVLELADQLQLSAEQRKKTQAIFDGMKFQAVSLGKQLVEKEQLLDSRFAEGTISDAEVERLVTEISVLQAKLRTAHLRAHLTQRAVLTQDQIKHYAALRGVPAA